MPVTQRTELSEDTINFLRTVKRHDKQRTRGAQSLAHALKRMMAVALNVDFNKTRGAQFAGTHEIVQPNHPRGDGLNVGRSFLSLVGQMGGRRGGEIFLRD